MNILLRISQNAQEKKSRRTLEVRISSLFQIEVVLGLKCLRQRTINRTVILKHICHRLLPKTMKQRASGGQWRCLNQSAKVMEVLINQSFLAKLDLIQTSILNHKFLTGHLWLLLMYLLVSRLIYFKVATAPQNQIPTFFGLIDPAEGFKESQQSCRGLCSWRIDILGEDTELPSH